MPTIWTATLHPGIPMNVTGAIDTEQSPPIIEPKLDVSCSHPKAAPRLLSSVESATRDWIACATTARPMPFKALETATCLRKAEWLGKAYNQLVCQGLLFLIIAYQKLFETNSRTHELEVLYFQIFSFLMKINCLDYFVLKIVFFVTKNLFR